MNGCRTAIPLDCVGLTWRDGIYGYTNTLEERALSPRGFSYRYASTLPENDRIFPSVGPIRIVMKDGSVFYKPTGGAAVWTGGNVTPESAPDAVLHADRPVWSDEDSILFDALLDLSQADYVRYGEHKIPIPAN